MDLQANIYRSFERLTSNFQAIRDLIAEKQQEDEAIGKTWTSNHFCTQLIPYQTHLFLTKYDER